MKRVSKFKMFIAWLLLIILIASAIALTYLKFFVKDIENIGKKPEENKQVVSKEDINKLNKIADTFNSSTYTTNYNKDNNTITAYVEEGIFYIKTTGNIQKTYQFEFNNPELSIIYNGNDEEFIKIFENLVISIQSNLGNNEDLTDFLNNFFNDIEVNGLTKTKDEFNNVTYSIDIEKKIEIDLNFDFDAEGNVSTIEKVQGDD